MWDSCCPWASLLSPSSSCPRSSGVEFASGPGRHRPTFHLHLHPCPLFLMCYFTASWKNARFVDCDVSDVWDTWLLKEKERREGSWRGWVSNIVCRLTLWSLVLWFFVGDIPPFWRTQENSNQKIALNAKRLYPLNVLHQHKAVYEETERGWILSRWSRAVCLRYVYCEGLRC